MSNINRKYYGKINMAKKKQKEKPNNEESKYKIDLLDYIKNTNENIYLKKAFQRYIKNTGKITVESEKEAEKIISEFKNMNLEV